MISANDLMVAIGGWCLVAGVIIGVVVWLRCDDEQAELPEENYRAARIAALGGEIARCREELDRLENQS